MGRDQPHVPRDNEQREKRERQRNSDRQGARHLARVFLTGATREVAQCRAQTHEDCDEQADDERSEQVFHLALQFIGCSVLSNSQRPDMPATGTPARRFSPSWSLTVGAVLLCALFIRLGFWQWDRGNARQAQWNEFSRGADAAIALGSRGLGDVARF